MPASDQLQRILYILAAATREDGIALDELARALDVPVKTIVRDLQQATERAFYQLPGTVDPFSILIEDGRVQVFTTGEFARPVRLTAQETLALGLGLRTLAAEADEPRRSDVIALAERLERDLRVPGIELQPRVQPSLQDGPASSPNTFEIALGQDESRGVLADAIEKQRVCIIDYLKAGEPNSTARRIAPVQLIYANGRWYVAGFDLDRDALRRFRLDRVLHAQASDQRFELALLPADTEPTAHYSAEADQEYEVTVHYSPRIAPWIAEHARVEPAADGSVCVQHQVADPRWLVRHVLQYGGDAVVLEPAQARTQIHQRALELAG